jgi:3-hydroxyisobutyrate dehydrogenase
MANVGFVGLGVMGAPMAGHLLDAGHHLVVWNRSPGKAGDLESRGAKVANSLADLASVSDVIITCVGTSEDVAEVVRAMVDSAKPNTLFIDQSTIEPAMAEILYNELNHKNLRFVDAPVTGGSMGAQAGTLTIFCGGDEKAVAEAIDIMRPYFKRAERVGEASKGQVMKLANQIAIGGALLGLCESLAFAVQSGLDMNQAHSMIGSGAGGSWAFENYGPKILNTDWSPGFSVKNQRKDFFYCESAARDLGLKIPLTILANEQLAKLTDAGRNEQTTAALYETYFEPEKPGGNS